MLSKDQEEDLQRASRKAAIRAALGLGLVVIALVLLAFQLHRSKSSLQTIQAVSQAQERQVASQQQAIELGTTENSSLKGIVNKTLAAVDANSNNAKSSASVLVLDKAIESDPKGAQAIVRVYPHIRNPKQRQHAEAVVAYLRQQGFIVPGVDSAKYAGAPPPETQLHYYADDQQETQDVQNIQKALASINVSAEAVKVPHSPPAGKRMYGLWFGDDF